MSATTSLLFFHVPIHSTFHNHCDKLNFITHISVEIYMYIDSRRVIVNRHNTMHSCSDGCGQIMYV